MVLEYENYIKIIFYYDEDISKDNFEVSFVSVWRATMEKFVEGEVDKTCRI